MKNRALRAGLAAGCLCASAALAQDSAAPVRIMLGVAPPAETLAAQTALYAPVQAPPGTSPGAAALGQLLGVLLIGGIEQSRERRVAEFAAGVSQALSAIDLRRELAGHLRQALARTSHLKSAVLEEVTDASDLEQPGLLVRIEEREIFTLDVRCMFDRRLTSLHLLTQVRLWRKDDFKPERAARLRYVSKSFADEEEARRRWIAEDGALLRHALREGIAETARMFMAETALRAAGGAPLAETAQAAWTAAETGKSTGAAPIDVLARDPERILGRTKAPAEEIISIPQESAATFQ